MISLEKLGLLVKALWKELVLLLPDELSRVRVSYYNRRGCNIARYVSLSPNVRIRGKVDIGTGSSVAQNSTISGGNCGVRIGKNVMIAPNVVIVAFDHGFDRTDIPMVLQESVEKAILIEDDVWIGANVTISKGVTIGAGTIVGANSFVNRDVDSMCVYAGVPARMIARR